MYNLEMISLKYTFKLENESTHTITIRDVKENITEAEIKTLANSFIEKNLEHKGSKFSEFVKCEKIVTNTEIITP